MWVDVEVLAKDQAKHAARNRRLSPALLKGEAISASAFVVVEKRAQTRQDMVGLLERCAPDMDLIV
jgi:hypothetical protein